MTKDNVRQVSEGVNKNFEFFTCARRHKRTLYSVNVELKIPDIRILDLVEAEKYLFDTPEDFQFTHVLSLGETEGEPKSLGKPTAKVLRLNYEDLVHQNNLVGLAKGYTQPSREHVKKVVEFTQGVTTPILVHCTAGVSRSSSMALAILMERYGAGREVEAFDHLKRIKERILPNDITIGFIDQLHDCQGNLIREYKKRYGNPLMFKDSGKCKRCVKGGITATGSLQCHEHYNDIRWVLHPRFVLSTCPRFE